MIPRGVDCIASRLFKICIPVTLDYGLDWAIGSANYRPTRSITGVPNLLSHLISLTFFWSG
jgi:hypothetical protein